MQRTPQRCPICGGHEFGDYRGRKLERCTGCGAKERTRMHYLILNRMPEVRKDLPVFHLAPDRPIAEKLIGMFWQQYRPVDLFPDEYQSPVPITRLDLTTDLSSIPDNSVGGFVHSHVLEHLRAPVGNAMKEMNRVIAPGGFHFFCVPIGAKQFEEDYGSELTDEDRLRRFGQEDHVRVFGTEDFESMFIAPYFQGFTRTHIDDLISPYEASRSAIRVGNIRRRPQPQTFLFIKN